MTREEIKESVEGEYIYDSNNPYKSHYEATLANWNLALDRIRELKEGIERDSHWKEDWQKLNKHMEEKLNLLIDKKARIKELEAELQREEQAHTMSVYDLNIRIVDLEEGIEGILNQKDLISFTIQKQLEGLIGGKEKP